MQELKILVVADGIDEEYVHKSLDAAGLQFQTAYTADEALDRGKAFQPDVYFLDEKFYRVGSLHLQRLRQISKNAAIYVMAENAAEFAGRANSEAAGISIMGMEKPLQLGQVLGELEGLSQILNFKKVESPAIEETMRVLVVDKSETIANFVMRAISERWPNAEFMYKGDGYEGLQAIKKQQKKFHLVVTDLELPGLQGDEMLLVAGAEGRLNTTPVMVLSNRVTADLRKDLSEYNVAFLRKPAIPSQIVAGVQMLLSSRTAAKTDAA